MMTPDLDWKQDLQHRCLLAISQLPDEQWAFEGSDVSEEGASTPSLYKFHEELITIRNEVRKINRKTAGTLTRFGDVLEDMRQDSGKLREHLNKEFQSKKIKSGVSRNMALTMVDLLDRAQRLEKASDKQLEKGWLGGFNAHNHELKQRGAVSIFTDHLQKLLANSNIERINIQVDDVFDPLIMKAVGDLGGNSAGDHSKSQLVVSEVILPGYRLGQQCLRPVEVSLTRKPSL